jgi:hypothetical protein
LAWTGGRDSDDCRGCFFTSNKYEGCFTHAQGYEKWALERAKQGLWSVYELGLLEERPARVTQVAFHRILESTPMSLSNHPNATTPTTSFSVGATPTVPTAEGFFDRRSAGGDSGNSERRQFGSSHQGLSEDGRELALAIDRYKVQSHRRYITCDEMLQILTELGYSKRS